MGSPSRFCSDNCILLSHPLPDDASDLQGDCTMALANMGVRAWSLLVLGLYPPRGKAALNGGQGRRMSPVGSDNRYPRWRKGHPEAGALLRPTVPATAGNRLSLQAGQPPGTAWNATAPFITALTDISRAFYRGPSERERSEHQTAVWPAGSSLPEGRTWRGINMRVAG